MKRLVPFDGGWIQAAAIIAWTAFVIGVFVWFNPPKECPLIHIGPDCDELAPLRNLLIGGALLAWCIGMLVIVAVIRQRRR